MDGKLYINKDEYQTSKIKTRECYEIDVDKISSVADLIILFKAMHKDKLFVADACPYYEDLKHLKKDDE